jgi:uncharacterized protein (TIGR01244 family)
MNAHRKVLGGLVSAFAAAAVLAAADTRSISGFYCVEDGVAVGGQPTVEQVPTLAAEGYRTVINLRLAFEFDAGPVAFAARQAGMSYVSVPISAKQPTDEAVDEFLLVTDDPGIYPIFIHCGSGNRAAALWMIRRVLREGWHVEIAMSEASAAGLESEVMRDFALDYIRRHAMAQAAVR